MALASLLALVACTPQEPTRENPPAAQAPTPISSTSEIVVDPSALPDGIAPWEFGTPFDVLSSNGEPEATLTVHEFRPSITCEGEPSEEPVGSWGALHVTVTTAPDLNRGEFSLAETFELYEYDGDPARGLASTRCDYEGAPESTLVQSGTTAAVWVPVDIPRDVAWIAFRLVTDEDPWAVALEIPVVPQPPLVREHDPDVLPPGVRPVAIGEPFQVGSRLDGASVTVTGFAPAISCDTPPAQEPRGRWAALGVTVTTGSNRSPDSPFVPLTWPMTYRGDQQIDLDHFAGCTYQGWSSRLALETPGTTTKAWIPIAVNDETGWIVFSGYTAGGPDYAVPVDTLP